MLPFTKRPGRGDEQGDLVMKDDGGKPSVDRVPPPVQSARPRQPMPSVSDDEMTAVLPSKSLGLPAVMSSPRPAAGVPAARASVRPATVPPPRSSRSVNFVAEEEEEGRTVVRGVTPKVLRRQTPSGRLGGPTMPTTISPAAVIKATLESARAGKRRDGDMLMAPPPADLLDDLGDTRENGVGAERTVLLAPTASSNVHVPALASASHVAPGATGMSHALSQMHAQMAAQAMHPATGHPHASYPPPPTSSAMSGGMMAYASGSTGVPPAASSMPAHFMVAPSPYTDGRMDPPGTSVTSRTKLGGRPAMSWAVALLAFGLFVGVGAVALMQGTDGVAEATAAAFVDPANAPGANKVAAGSAQVASGVVAAPVPVPVAEEAKVGVPPVVVPAGTSAVAVGAEAVPSSGSAAVPAVAPVAVAPSSVTPVSVAKAPAPTAVAPVVAAAAPVTMPKPVEPKAEKPTVTAPAPAPKPVVASPVPRPAAPAPTPKPVVASNDEPKPAKPAKPSAKGASGKGSDVDEETKKALEALQKSQLESTF